MCRESISNEKIGYKIREARLKKIPYIIVVGDNEVNDNPDSEFEESTDESDIESDIDSSISISDDSDNIDIVIEISEDENILDAPTPEDIVISKHKVQGKHSLKYDSIFKGKKDEKVDEESDSTSMYFNEKFEVDKSSFFYVESHRIQVLIAF